MVVQGFSLAPKFSFSTSNFVVVEEKFLKRTNFSDRLNFVGESCPPH